MRPRICPPPHARIDWTHPLTRGLTVAFHAGALFANTYGGNGMAILNGGRRKTSFARGIRGGDYYEGNGTDGLAYLGDFKSSTEATVVTQLQLDGLGGGGYARLFDVQQGNIAVGGWSSSTVRFDLYRITSGTAALGSSPTFSTTSDTWNTVGLNIADSVTITDCQLFWNGAPATITQTTAGTGSAASNNTLVGHYMFGNSGNARNVDGRTRFYYMWTRKLTPAEHQLLARDPWTFWVWDIETTDLGLGGPYTIETNLTTFSNVARSGSAMSWQNTSNAQTSNDSSANTYVPGAVPTGVYTTDYLVGSDLVKTIPDASVIAGIEVDVERKRDGSHNEKDSQVKLRRAGVLESTDKADTVTVWPTTDTVKTYGSTTDKWSASWSRADLNDSGFGVAISITGDAGMGGEGG